MKELIAGNLAKGEKKAENQALVATRICGNRGAAYYRSFVSKGVLLAQWGMLKVWAYSRGGPG